MTIMSKARKTLGGGRRTPGSAKGQVTMAPDFDAPLEDFADYR